MIEKLNCQLLIIGTYMPFDNPKKKDESISQYEMSLCMISTLIQKYKYLKIPILIIGDFNADLRRKNKFDIVLSKFILDQNLIAIDLLHTQKVDHTYSFSQNFQKDRKLNLDHVLFTELENSKSIIENINCTILDDIANSSDHNPVIINIILDQNRLTNKTEETISLEPLPYENVNFENLEILNYYNQQIEYLIEDSNSYEINQPVTEPNHQNFVNSLYLNITNIITKAKSNTILFQQEMFEKNRNNPNFNNHTSSNKSKWSYKWKY